MSILASFPNFHEITTMVLNWMGHYGYWVLFGLLFACGLGLPLPEDIPLITAGMLVQRGQFRLATAALCAWCGIIGGDCVLYHLGKAFGQDVTKIPVIGHHVSHDRLKRVEGWFSRYGVLVVAVGRLFAGVRGAMVVVAGTIRFNFLLFLIADGLAAIVSGGIFLLLGYKFAQNWDRLEELVSRTKSGMLIGGAILLIAVIAYIYFQNWRRRRAAALRARADSLPPSNAGNKPAQADLTPP